MSANRKEKAKKKKQKRLSGPITYYQARTVETACGLHQTYRRNIHRNSTWNIRSRSFLFSSLSHLSLNSAVRFYRQMIKRITRRREKKVTRTTRIISFKLQYILFFFFFFSFCTYYKRSVNGKPVLGFVSEFSCGSKGTRAFASDIGVSRAHTHIDRYLYFQRNLNSSMPALAMHTCMVADCMQFLLSVFI